MLRLLRQGQAGALRQLQGRPGRSGRRVAVHPPTPSSGTVHLLQPLRKMACRGVVTRELNSLCPITTDVFPHWGLPPTALFPPPAFISLRYGFLISSSRILLPDRPVGDDRVHGGGSTTLLSSVVMVTDARLPHHKEARQSLVAMGTERWLEMFL